VELNNSSINKLICEMIRHQEAKVFEIARELVPCLTLEDIRNPQDFPELNNNTTFNYEDGILTGYLSIKIALNKLNKA
tara:strand:+ start:135 stop:368 length:234 start_codon:yes stop_codon:yes gene_type:complete